MLHKILRQIHILGFRVFLGGHPVRTVRCIYRTCVVLLVSGKRRGHWLVWDTKGCGLNAAATAAAAAAVATAAAAAAARQKNLGEKEGMKMGCFRLQY